MSSSKTKPARPLSRALLHEHAEWYLERWWPSAKRLEQVLKRKADRHATNAEERAQGHLWAREVTLERVQRGHLDDRKFARLWAEQLDRKGISQRAIHARLMQKGVEADIIQAVLADLAVRLGPRAEELRARAYARRRRLGPFRRDQERRTALRQRDLAAMARAGFAFDIALRVIDGDPDEWEAETDDSWPDQSS